MNVCESDFDAYIKTNILRPFGMASSGYQWTGQSAKVMAHPHDENGNPLPYRKPTTADVVRYGAMGGLLTTPSDFAKFSSRSLRQSRRTNFGSAQTAGRKCCGVRSKCRRAKLRVPGRWRGRSATQTMGFHRARREMDMVSLDERRIKSAGGRDLS